MFNTSESYLCLIAKSTFSVIPNKSLSCCAPSNKMPFFQPELWEETSLLTNVIIMSTSNLFLECNRWENGWLCWDIIHRSILACQESSLALLLIYLISWNSCWKSRHLIIESTYIENIYNHIQKAIKDSIMFMNLRTTCYNEHCSIPSQGAL